MMSSLPPKADILGKYEKGLLMTQSGHSLDYTVQQRPNNRRAMKTTSMIALLLGLAVVSVLVVWQGLETEAALLANAGWPLLLVSLFAPLDQFASSRAWRVLFPAAGRPRTFETLAAS